MIKNRAINGKGASRATDRDTPADSYSIFGSIRRRCTLIMAEFATLTCTQVI